MERTIKPPVVNTTHRIAINETCYHIPPRGQPVSLVSRLSRPLHTDEQSYSRRLPIGGDWTAIDFGWVGEDKVGTLVFFVDKDRQKIAPQAIPSPIVEVGVVVEDPSYLHSGGSRIMPLWLIFPGEYFRGNPINPKDIRIRSLVGNIKLSLLVIPM